MEKGQRAYEKIENYLLDSIAEGQGRSSPLPGEVELTKLFGVSRMTVRQAYNSLVTAGLVTRHRSKGSFARVHLSEDISSMTRVDFLDRWREQDYLISIEVTAFELRTPPKSVARSFGVSVETRLTYIERLRSADGEPVAWDSRWLPPDLAGVVTDSGTLESKSVFALLTEYGYELGKMDFDLWARKATTLESERLNCPTGDSVLIRSMRCATRDQETVLVGHSVYPSERVTFHGELPFSGEMKTQADWD